MNRHTQHCLLASTMFLVTIGWGAADWLRFIAKPSVATAQTARDLTTPTRQPRLYGHWPIAFEANLGQTDARVKFLARSGGHTLFLTDDEAVLRLPQAATLRLQLMKSNPTARVSGVAELPTKSNYLRGNDPQRYFTGVRNYARVRYEQAWPGIDLVWHTGQAGRALEYDLLIAPGAQVKTARLKLSGMQLMTIDRQGALVLPTAGGTVRMLKPEA